MFFKRSQTSHNISPSEAAARSDIQIVDVRTTQEWQSGHAPGAKHIPLDQLRGRLGELNHGRAVAFICQSGTRSKMARKIAGQAGLEAINISGGMSAWQRAGLPTSTR